MADRLRQAAAMTRNAPPSIGVQWMALETINTRRTILLGQQWCAARVPAAAHRPEEGDHAAGWAAHAGHDGRCSMLDA
jgi:hypothetical protein